MRSALLVVAAAWSSVAAAAPPDPVAAEYVSAARPNGVAGGAAAGALSKQVAGALRARGDVAEADGALASAAAWFLAASTNSRKRGSEAAARRAGFLGAVLTSAVFPIADADAWRSALAALARNVPVSRYGVFVAPDGIVGAVVFGDVALKLDPIPRHAHAGATLRLRGEIARRFDRASVFVTDAGGRVSKTPLDGRRVDAGVQLSAAGIYRVEVMGDGAAGPVVVANVPIYVDTAEPPAAPEPAPSPQGDAAARTPEEAQARLLALLGDARRAAGSAALVSDPQLAAVARAHTQDMAAARFFGHASPTTGRVEDRLRRAGVVVTKMGENISQGDTADAAFRALMVSPSHRANLVDPAFTHVGVAVVIRAAERPALLVTMVLARRPRPPAAPLTSAAALDFVSARRRARGAAPIEIDPALQHAAEAGLQVALRGGESAASSPALDAAQAELASEARRLQQRRPTVCAQLLQIQELDELDADPMLSAPGPGRMGLAAGTKKVGQRATLLVLVVAASATCK